MVKEVLEWGLNPKVVTADSWYASTATFKFLRNPSHTTQIGSELSFLLGIEKNRIISTQVGQYEQVGAAPIPPEGLYTHLKEFDFAGAEDEPRIRSKVFQRVDPDNDVRYYVYFHPDQEKRHLITRAGFEKAHQDHWHTDGEAHPLEVFHRPCKQGCNIERFLVRTSVSIKTHWFAALRAFVRLSAMVRDQLLDSFYSLHRQRFLQAQREFMLNCA